MHADEVKLWKQFLSWLVAVARLVSLLALALFLIGTTATWFYRGGLLRQNDLSDVIDAATDAA